MKNVLIFIVILALLAGVGVFFLQQRTGITVFQTEKFEIAEVLPENPVLYVELQDVRDNLERLTGTPFWNALGLVDWELIVSSQTGPKKAAMTVAIVKEILQNPEELEGLDKFLGQDISFAIYPFEVNMAALQRGDPNMFREISQRIGESMYIVTRLDAEAQLAEYLSGSFNEFGNSVSIDEVIYKDQSIKVARFTQMDVEFAFTRIKDLLILSFDKFAIQRAIDVHQEAIPNLDTDANYGLTRSTFIQDNEFRAYINSQFVLKTIADSLMKMAEQEGLDTDAVQEQINETFQAVMGFRSLGFSGLWTDLLQTKVDFHFNLEEMDPDVARYYQSCVNSPNASIDIIPQETMGYQWSHCFDLQYYWDEMKKGMEQRVARPGEPSPDQVIAQYEQMIGLSVEGDILKAFGKEIGGYLTTIHVDRKFPIPELALFLRVADRQKADKIMNLLKNQPMAVFQTETHGDVAVNYVALPIADNVTPAYAFIGDYLMIAVNKEMLANSANAYTKSVPGLVDNETFAAVNRGLLEDNTGVMYLELDELAYKLTSILEWSEEWASSNDKKQEAFRVGAEMRLTKVQETIEADEKVLVETQTELKQLRERADKMRETGQDLGMLEKTLARMEEKEAALRGDIEANIDEALEIQDTIKGYTAKGMPREEREKYIYGIVYPLIGSLKAIDGLGVVSTMSESVMETRMYTGM